MRGNKYQLKRWMDSPFCGDEIDKVMSKKYDTCTSLMYESSKGISYISSATNPNYQPHLKRRRTIPVPAHAHLQISPTSIQCRSFYSFDVGMGRIQNHNAVTSSTQTTCTIIVYSPIILLISLGKCMYI